MVLVEFRKQRWLGIDQRLSRFGCHGFFRFQASVATNMKHCMTALDKDTPNQKAAVAMRRVFFPANQGDSKALHPVFKASDGCFELGIFTKPPINHPALGVIVVWVGRTATQIRAKKKVAEP